MLGLVAAAAFGDSTAWSSEMLENTQVSDIYTVYILRCADDSLYTGIAKDLEKRLGQHAHGKGAKYVASRLPFALAYQENAASKGEALRREAAIKRLTRKEKLALIGSVVAGDTL